MSRPFHFPPKPPIRASEVMGSWKGPEFTRALIGIENAKWAMFQNPQFLTALRTAGYSLKALAYDVTVTNTSCRIQKVASSFAQ